MRALTWTIVGLAATAALASGCGNESKTTSSPNRLDACTARYADALPDDTASSQCRDADEADGLTKDGHLKLDGSATVNDRAADPALGDCRDDFNDVVDEPGQIADLWEGMTRMDAPPTSVTVFSEDGKCWVLPVSVGRDGDGTATVGTLAVFTGRDSNWTSESAVSAATISDGNSITAAVMENSDQYGVVPITSGRLGDFRTASTLSNDRPEKASHSKTGRDDPAGLDGVKTYCAGRMSGLACAEDAKAVAEAVNVLQDVQDAACSKNGAVDVSTSVLASGAKASSTFQTRYFCLWLATTAGNGCFIVDGGIVSRLRDCEGQDLEPQGVSDEAGDVAASDTEAAPESERTAAGAPVFQQNGPSGPGYYGADGTFYGLTLPCGSDGSGC